MSPIYFYALYEPTPTFQYSSIADGPAVNIDGVPFGDLLGGRGNPKDVAVHMSIRPYVHIRLPVLSLQTFPQGALLAERCHLHNNR